MAYNINIDPAAWVKQTYEAIFGAAKEPAEGEDVQQRTWAGWAWSTGCVVAEESLKIALPVALVYFGGSYVAPDLMKGDLGKGILISAGAVGVSPHLGTLRNYTTDLAVNASKVGAVYTANKATEIGASAFVKAKGMVPNLTIMQFGVKDESKQG